MRTPQAIPHPLRSLAFRQEGLLTVDQCGAAGVGRAPVRRLVASGDWGRVTRGVLDVDPRRDRQRDADHRRRRSAWIAMLAYGPDAVAVGACALALHGVRGLPLDIVPEVALRDGRSHRARDGIVVRQYQPLRTVRYGTRAIADLVPALVHAVPGLGRDNAVAVLDDVLHRGVLTSGGLEEVDVLLRGRRCCVEARSWLDLVDARSESPLESVARLRCTDAGIPPDELQVEIRSPDGRFLGRGDLGWRLRNGRWLIAEIDGREFHELPEALLRDRTRQNALLSSGRVELLRFTSTDIASRSTIPLAVRRALERDAGSPAESTMSLRPTHDPLPTATTWSSSPLTQ